MHRGYVKLWRKSLDSTVWQNPNAWRLLCYCLMKATHKPTEQLVGYQQVHLEPGDLIFGRNKASKDTKLPVKTIRSSIKFLKMSRIVAIKRASKYSIISIVNWAEYQQDYDIEGHQSGHQSGHQRASKGPAKGHKQECRKT